MIVSNYITLLFLYFFILDKNHCLYGKRNMLTDRNQPKYQRWTPSKTIFLIPIGKSNVSNFVKKNIISKLGLSNSIKIKIVVVENWDEQPTVRIAHFTSALDLSNTLGDLHRIWTNVIGRGEAAQNSSDVKIRPKRI